MDTDRFCREAWHYASINIKMGMWHLRCDDSFVQDEGWYSAAERYEDFIRRHVDMHVLFLELGVGFNTPAIIKYPFWRMTAGHANAVYACINSGEPICPKGIEGRAICIDRNIADVLDTVKTLFRTPDPNGG